jgi:hypothetical protein
LSWKTFQTLQVYPHPLSANSLPLYQYTLWWRKSIGFLVLPVSLKWCWLENGYSCFYRRKDEYFLFYQYCCILGEDITSTTPVVFFKYLTKSCPIIFLLQLWQSTTTGVLKSSCESNINNNTHRTLQSHSPSLCWCWKRSW